MILQSHFLKVDLGGSKRFPLPHVDFLIGFHFFLLLRVAFKLIINFGLNIFVLILNQIILKDVIDISEGSFISSTVSSLFFDRFRFNNDEIFDNFIFKLTRTAVGLLPADHLQLLIIVELLAMFIDLLVFL